MPPEPHVILRLEAIPGTLYPWVVLRWILKHMLWSNPNGDPGTFRKYGWKCVSIHLSDGPYFWGGLGI